MTQKILNIALADDDIDDRLLFKKAMHNLKLDTELSLFQDGQELMEYLRSPDEKLPQVIFLDLNMPVKNGMECLKEIRADRTFDYISIAIYSTSSSENDIEETFIQGANVYINKPNSFKKLKQAIEKVVQLNWQYNTSRLDRDNFLLRI